MNMSLHEQSPRGVQGHPNADAHPTAPNQGVPRPPAPPPPPDPAAARRIICHFDIDCFYAQVEELRDPRLANRAMAVTQKYLIVTCNYPARAAGRGLHSLTSELNLRTFGTQRSR